MRISARIAAIAAAVAATTLAAAAPAPAAFTPNGTEYHPLTFPVREAVHYFDDFGGVRNHPGNDLMGAKLDHLLAANDGTITFVRGDSSGHSGNMLILTGTDGWKYWYIHINNDTPGTDDGKNPPQWRFAPGIALGVHVTRGQFIAYMGDSGEAETTDPHLHFELHRPNDTFIDPYTSLRLAQGAGANGLCRYPTSPTAHPSTSAGRGYRTIGFDGTVLSFGSVTAYGRGPVTSVWDPYVAIGSTPSGNGYWVVDAKGAVTALGDAHAYGGMQNVQLNQPMIGIAPTPTGRGYWLLALDGGIFSFGDARFYGSMGGTRLNAPVISMAATPGGRGYWLLGADGGVFSFGDAKFSGSTGSMHIATPATAMTSTPTGGGYWIVTSAGEVYRFGDALDEGSIVRNGWCPGPTARTIARTTTAHGYWILLSNGQVVPFGDAAAYGQPSTTGRTAMSLTAVP